MATLNATIYRACMIVSSVLFIISFFSQGTKSIYVNSYLTGCSVLIFGIMMMLIILFNNILKQNQNASNSQLFFRIFGTTGPFIFTLFILGFVLYLFIKYYTRINEGHISNSYYSFSNVFVMLMLLQIFLVYKYIDSDLFETSGKIPKVVNSIIYLLGLFSFICSTILFIILKYYTTDGFTNIY